MAGRYIRKQIASAAFGFPRSAGTGEPLATATQLVTVDQQVRHKPAYPIHVLLPVPTPR